MLACWEKAVERVPLAGLPAHPGEVPVQMQVEVDDAVVA